MEEETKKKLAEVSARRKARADAREAKAEASKLAEDLAIAERLDALEEALVKAEDDHGPRGRGVAVVHARYADGSIAGSLIVKKPSAFYWSKASAKVGSVKEEKIPDAIAEVWRHCLVYPSLEEAERIVDEIPATPHLLFNAIAALAGSFAEEAAGKS